MFIHAYTQDTHLQDTHDDLGRASPPVVFAVDDIRRRLIHQAPPEDDPRAFFYGRVWFDNNANGKMDTREEGMPFVEVSLWRTDLSQSDKVSNHGQGRIL